MIIDGMAPSIRHVCPIAIGNWFKHIAVDPHVKRKNFAVSGLIGVTQVTAVCFGGATATRQHAEYQYAKTAAPK